MSGAQPADQSKRCVVCGQPFLARNSKARFCTAACRMRSWRAAMMLAGTHGYVGNRFTRLDR